MQLLVRLGFRIASLVLKFALTIIVARTLGFSAVADLGLALAISVLSSKLLGLGFSTEINRRLSAANPARAIHDARRLLLLYCVGYVAVGIIVMIVYRSAAFNAFSRITPGILWGVVLVAFSEHAGLETTSYVFSLHRQRAGALLLFIRTGGWAGVAIIGLLADAIHSVETIFLLWCGTNVVAALAACWCMSRKSRELELNRSTHGACKVGGFRSVWMDGLPFFFAAIVLSGLQYGERFLASQVFSSDALGRYVFAWSISNSIQTVAYATIVVTAGPRLVRALSSSGGAFGATLRHSLLSSVGITLLAAAAILIVHRPIFHMAHEPAGSREFGTLLILLVSFVLRSIADVYWVSAVALRLGRQVVFAIFCVAVLSIPAEWTLINRLGETGAALAHLTASTGIVAVLASIVMRTRTSDGTTVVRNEEATHAS
ncbi:O-antigen/teichoic acid export membrane protein [Paraburkholderia sp. HC6.4b]|uniref:lipopolysaccharide biosynthesis protein n=1 Tax=unclassified Paraburkholderia TaxID=2615204 RepID=UPI0016133CEB|nr:MULTISPECIES: polysaccharide biosynthesis protein [unclassified Paraburkholderia]MBB5409190.1 O-antigen/teichoic acid export membrane protein [Paraburkholderia sp. HC6.4b]MBB5450918.1 O-antigen/teichoic acid export membrane protein [Paraburkholderia sp. Kb1A]